MFTSPVIRARAVLPRCRFRSMGAHCKLRFSHAQIQYPADGRLMAFGDY
jgi:hypothetical protein